MDGKIKMEPMCLQAKKDAHATKTRGKPGAGAHVHLSPGPQPLEPEALLLLQPHLPQVACFFTQSWKIETRLEGVTVPCFLFKFYFT